MLFILVFALAALGTVALVCLPLMVGAPVTAERRYFDRAVYRDQLGEVERDLSRGVLDAREAGSARLEIQRRLLAADASLAGRKTWSAHNPQLAAMLALLVLGGAAALYWRLGAPSLPDAPFAARHSPHGEQAPAADAAPHLDMRQAAAKLEEKLQADPANAEGWELYARTESMLSDWPKAGAAYRHAIELGQRGPEVFAGYGEMLVLAADGIVSPAAHDAFTEALVADAKNDVARYYLALADHQAGDERRAIDRWLALAADIPDDSPMREAIARGVAAAAKAGGIVAPALPQGLPPQPPSEAEKPQAGPTQDQVASAASMPEGERKQMILGMVAQLAARLQTQPDDLDGWLRLGRSYAALGETDKAVDAFDHAARLKPNDISIKLQEFQALIGSLQPTDPLPARAVALLQQVAAAAPDAPEPLWYLGVQAAREGNADEARRDWTKLLATLPAVGEDARLVKNALDTLPK